MDLIHVKGNTWYINANECIPLYKTSENTCILLDSGELVERDFIETVLEKNHLRPIGIIGTHAHTDHSSNHSYFQKKYDIPVALPLGEAGISANHLSLKAYFYMFSQQQLESYKDFVDMKITADKIIMPHEKHILFCDAMFQIVRTPGHSPDHIAVITPDQVLCLGDALLTKDQIQKVKLPYFFSIKNTLDTMQQLNHYDDYLCLASHKGICENLGETIDAHLKIINETSAQIADCITDTMTFDEILIAVCERFSLLSSNIFKCKLYERNIRIYIDYLTDIDAINVFAHKGMIYYKNKQDSRKDKL